MKRGAMCVIAIALGTLCLSEAQAKDKAVGQGRGRGRPETAADSVKGAGKAVVDEAVDATVDELVGERQKGSTPSGMPPGLSKKGKMPPGLEKQGKVPPGWRKGKKEGWDQAAESSPRKEGLIRRIIKGIFRGKKSASSPPAGSE